MCQMNIGNFAGLMDVSKPDTQTLIMKQQCLRENLHLICNATKTSAADPFEVDHAK